MSMLLWCRFILTHRNIDLKLHNEDDFKKSGFLHIVGCVMLCELMQVKRLFR
jgi:hypothetical protein